MQHLPIHFLVSWNPFSTLERELNTVHLITWRILWKTYKLPDNNKNEIILLCTYMYSEWWWKKWGEVQANWGNMEPGGRCHYFAAFSKYSESRSTDSRVCNDWSNWFGNIFINKFICVYLGLANLTNIQPGIQSWRDKDQRNKLGTLLLWKAFQQFKYGRNLPVKRNDAVELSSWSEQMERKV
jgi:hypothetical protein